MTDEVRLTSSREDSPRESSTDKEYIPIVQILAADVDSSIDIKIKYPKVSDKEDIIWMLKDTIHKLESEE